MFRIGPLSFFLLLLNCLSLSLADYQFHQVNDSRIPVVVNDVREYGVVSFETRRLLQENEKNSTLILAAQRTHRKDPRDDFKYYTGGWNISSEHYISSAAFTGAPLFLIAAIWFIGFGLCLLLICLCFCCCTRRPYGYSRTAYVLSLIFLSLLTTAAIVGCVVLYTGQGKFHNRTTDVLDYVVSQADITVENLKNVSNFLAAAKRVGVDQVFLAPDIQNNIDNVGTKINSSAITLQRETNKNKKDIKEVLDIVSLVLIVVAAVMLLLAFLGFFFSIVGWQVFVYTLVIIVWILVAATFILCGVFLVLHNVMGDTCVAMNQWVQNPTAQTALDDILPCVDKATAQQTLSQSKEVTYQLVGVVNQIITNVSNVNLPPSASRFSYNQSGPLVPVLCNPFNADKTNRTCAAGEIDFDNAIQVWRNYTCRVSDKKTCTTVGRLTPDMYDQMSNAVGVSYALYHYGPFLAGLLDCTFVRDTFSVIHDDHCPGLTKFSKWLYIGLAMVSSALMLSLIFWVLYARERQHRKYTKLVDATSQ